MDKIWHFSASRNNITRVVQQDNKARLCVCMCVCIHKYQLNIF